MSRFWIFTVGSFVLTASIVLWNLVDPFGVGNAITDNTNTLSGLLSYLSCGAGSNNVVNACNTSILVYGGLIVVGIFASGVFTLIAFGNRVFALGAFLIITPSGYTLYNTFVSILDAFGVQNFQAVAIGAVLGIIISMLAIEGIVEIAGGIKIGP
jgi:hypothetical protein